MVDKVKVDMAYGTRLINRALYMEIKYNKSIANKTHYSVTKSKPSASL